MKLKDNSTQEIDTALYQLEQRLKSNIRLTDVENSNASTAKINAVDKKLTEEIKDRQSADGKLQDNINKEIADRQEADAAIENAKQDKLIAGDNIQINGNIISATSKEYTAEAPVKVTDGKISLDTVPVNKGGTGVTTQADINKAFIGNLTVGNDNVTDGTEFVSSYASDKGFAEPSAINKPYKRQFIKVWNYIKDKISSVLGLTSEKVSSYDSHLINKDNPHSVTKSQVGLGSVVNTGDSATPVSGGTTKFTTGGAYTELNKVATAISTAETNAKNLANATGTLPVANGGTGKTTEKDAANAFINSLDIGTSDPEDADYYVSQYAGGGTTNTAYYRRPVSSLWNYIKDKISSVLGLTKDNYGGKASTAGNADTVDNYHASQLWRSDGATWNPNANVVMTPSGNGSEWSFDFRNKDGATGTYWQVWDENKNTLLRVNADDGKVSAPYGFVGNLSGKSAKSSFLDEYPGAGGTRLTSGNIKPKDSSEWGGMRKDVVTSSMTDSGRPGADGHLLTMFWDNSGRYDSQFFVSHSNPPVLKSRGKANGTDYGPWTDIITSDNIGSQTVANATNARTNADAGYLCKLYTLDSATSDTTSQAYNVILLGKIPDPASTAAPATPASSWDIDVDFYFVRSQGHKAAWCNVKAGYGYSNAWRKYGSIETFGVDSNVNYSKPFDLVTLKYNNEYYIGVRHTIDIDGSYAARVKYVNIGGSRNPSTVDNTPLVNMLKVIPYQKTTDGTILNNEIKTSIADFPNTYAPTVVRNGILVLPSGNVIVGNSSVAGSRLTIRGATVNSNSYADTNPKLEFKNNDGNQNISLTFTDWDKVQAPASLTLNGNQGDEYFIAPNIKATTKFIGNLTGNVTGDVTGSSGSASKLTTARKAYVDLGTASTTSTIDWSGDTTIPVNGVLQVEHGGTGATTAEDAANSLIASLPGSQSVPVDSDYFISQVVNGGPFVPGYERRPISKLWEYIKGKISQEGEEFGYDHIVHDGDSLLEWVNCTDGSMKKVLIKSGTYNITKGVNLSKAGTGYVLAENGAVINSHVPIAFTASSGKTVAYNLNVICDGAANGDNSCAFSASNPENLILYDCSATYSTYTEIVNRSLFVGCTCYNCSYAFQNLPANLSISVRVFYQCRCYNCKCKQTIEANSSTGISFYSDSYFYMECHCSSCDAELTTSRNIKAATNTFTCYYNCYDRCVGCLSKINVNSKALTVYSTLYGFLRCQYMSSCKETHTEGYTNIKGIVQCDYISSTSGINGGSNTHVGNSCVIH